MAEYPQQHPRSIIVRKAELDFRTLMLELQERHDLTEAELLMLLADYQSTTVQYLVRAERKR